MKNEKNCKPGEHWHLYLPIKSKHVPPLRQGSVAQSFIFVSHKSPVNPIQEINGESNQK